MDQFTAISKLRQLISKTEQPWVIAALRVDPLIWQFLCSGNLLELKKKDTGSLGNFRTPFNLACISMGLENSVDTRKTSFLELPSELQEEAVQLWETHFCKGKEIDSLRAAGLLTFLLLDKTSKGQTWEDVIAVLSSATDKEVTGNWKTIFGILYSIVDPPDNFVGAIVTSFKPKYAFETICHAILMQPQTISSQEDIFLHLFQSLSLQDQTICLKILNSNGYSQLVTRIGTKILEGQPENTQSLIEGIHAASLREDPKRIDTLNSIVEILDLTGESSLAAEILSKITQSLNEMAKDTDCKKQVLELGSAESIDPNQLPERGMSRILFSIIETSKQPGPEEKKKSEIIELVESLSIEKKSDYEFVEPIFTQALLIKALIAIESLGYPDLYNQYLDLMVKRFPEKDEILRLGLEQAFRVDDRKRAIELSNLFLAFHPDDLEVKAKFADLLESEGDLSQAYSERLDILNNSIVPNKEIQTKTAKLAFCLKDAGKAESICSDILGQDLENEQILSIRGLSRLQMGVDLLAENDLKQAVQLNPQNEPAWTGLVELSEKHKDEIKKDKTIQDALKHLPKSAFLNYQKAKMLLGSNSYTDALPFLRIANQSENRTLESVWDYANTLEQLGLQDEEKQLLEILESQIARDPRLMRLSARSLMREGKYAQAIEKLVPSIDLPEVDDKIYLEIAEAITGAESETFSQIGQIEKTFLKKVSDYLENLLKKNNQDIRIRYFYAQMKLDANEPREAYNLLKQLSQEPEAKTSRWFGNVQASLGRAALENGDHELALTLLREAALIQSKNLGIQKHLVKAYLENHLTEEAIDIAHQILASDPEDPDRLEWYSKLMKDAGNQKEAIQGYERLFNQADSGLRFAFPLVETLIADSQYIRAREVLLNLAESSDLGGNLYKEAAHYAIRLKDSSLAIQLLDKSQRKNPQDLETIALKTMVFQIIENYDGAIGEINKAIALDGQNAYWYLLRSDFTSSAGKKGDPISDLMHAQKIIEQGAPSDFRQMSELQPSIKGEDQLAARLGQQFLEKGQPGEAYIQFRKALQICPDNIQYRYQALQLADGLLFEDEFEQISEPTEIFRLANGSSKLSTDEKNALAGICGYLALRAMDKNENSRATKFLNTGREIDLENLHLRIADARIQIRNSNNQLAMNETFGIASLGSMPIDYSMALIELHQWKAALETARKNVRLNIALPKAKTILAKVITHILENNALRLEFGAKSIVIELGETKDQLTAEAFDALAKAKEFSSSSEFTRWESRLRLLGKVKPEDLTKFAIISSTPEEMVTLASAYRKLGLFGDLEKTLVQFPKFPSLMLQKAIFMKSTDPEAAMQIAEQIVEVEPENDLNWALIAQLLANCGKYFEAIQAMEKGIEIKSDEKEWYSLCAEWAKLSGNTALEISHLTKVLKITPSNFSAQKKLGEALIRAGMPERVIDTWRSFNSEKTESLEMHLQLAQACHMLKKDSECGLHLRTAIKIGGNTCAVNFEAGEILFKFGDPFKAYEYAKQAAVMDPKDPKTIILLAKILEIRNSAKDALTLIDKAMEKDVQTAEMMLEKARLVRKITGDKAAAEVYDKALLLDPGNGIIHAELADCLFNLGEIEDAKSHAMVSLNENEQQDLLKALVGKILQGQGQLDAAISYFISAIALSPKTLEHYLNLCQIYQMRREYQEALKTCRKAIEILPDEIQPYIIASQILKDGKDYGGAEIMIRKALELEPENLTIRRQLGAIIALNMVMSSQEVNSTL